MGRFAFMILAASPTCEKLGDHESIYSARERGYRNASIDPTFRRLVSVIRPLRST